MIVDPVFLGPQHLEMLLDLNELLNQVNEEDKDNEEEEEAPTVMQENVGQALESPQWWK
jgi:hypothetical protein